MKSTKYLITVTAESIIRQSVDDLEDSQSIPRLEFDGVKWTPTASELKNLTPVFELANTKAWDRYIALAELSDRETRWTRLISMFHNVTLRSWTRTVAQSGDILPKYGLGIYLDIPSSTQSVHYCSEGQVDHTKQGFDAIDSDYISLDREYVKAEALRLETLEREDHVSPDGEYSEDILDLENTVGLDDVEVIKSEAELDVECERAMARHAQED